MNMASKDKYKSLLERYKQALIKNPKLNFSAYCRLNGVSVSGMHHYIENIGQSVKFIRDAVLKATEHQDCEAFVPFTADSPHSDVDRADVKIQPSSGSSFTEKPSVSERPQQRTALGLGHTRIDPTGHT